MLCFIFPHPKTNLKVISKSEIFSYQKIVLIFYHKPINYNLFIRKTKLFSSFLTSPISLITQSQQNSREKKKASPAPIRR